MKTLNDIGEICAIELLVKHLPARADIIQGAGDDCAVVKFDDNSSHDWLLTSDAVIQGIHFTSETPPAAIGHKAVGRVLSDLAAMGGEPRWALMNIAAPPETPAATLDAIYQGSTDLADKFGLAIVGGDLTQAGSLDIHVFAAGSVPAGSALLRSRAAPGDLIFVTGSLGGSLQGKHLSFEPRIREGVWLRDWATALIDISDGLASDLRHMTRMSAAGAGLNTNRIPVSPAAGNINDGKSPLDHALYDGEDFELLFTVHPDKEQAFVSSWQKTFDLSCTSIGRITDKTNVIDCIDENGKVTTLDETGYEHFHHP